MEWMPDDWTKLIIIPIALLIVWILGNLFVKWRMGTLFGPVENAWDGVHEWQKEEAQKQKSPASD